MKELLELLQLKDLVKREIAYNEEGPHSDWKDLLHTINVEIRTTRDKLIEHY